MQHVTLLFFLHTESFKYKVKDVSFVIQNDVQTNKYGGMVYISFFMKFFFSLAVASCYRKRKLNNAHTIRHMYS